jgi:hypothetical protein
MTTTDLPPLPPAFRVSRLATSYWAPQALHAAAVLGLADVLASGPRTSAEAARTLATDADALHRLLRALVTLEVCTHDDADRFGLTELGECLRSDSRDSVRDWVLLVGGGRTWASWTRLAECIRTGQSVPTLDGHDSWVETTSDPEVAARFNQSMVQLTRLLAPAIAAAYDFSSFRTIVDVGGGYGALLPPILKVNAQLRGLVFDLPHCRDGARAIAEKTRLTDRYAFVAGDVFVDPLPPADAYVLKSVIHDWDDERSVAILRRIGAAMHADARVLVVEPLLPERPGTSPFDAMMAHTDLNMLVVTGGRERTEADFRALLSRAGLRPTRVLPTPAAFSIIEGRLP